MARLAKAVLLAAALGLITGAASASAAVTYTAQASSGASIVPGTADIGTHGDDQVTTINFPFPVSIYGQTYTSGQVSSNGNLQLSTSDTAFTNQCLPAATLGVAIMPYWDDLYLVNSGFGIFTSITGLAPHRTFNIEWRAQFFPGSGSANFEIQLHEDSPIITVIYGVNTAAGTSATVGVQSGTESFTQFSCNNPAGPIVSGLRIDFVPGGVGALHVLKKGTGTGTVTSPDPGINCGATCDAWFAEGTNKVLTATPATGSRFVGWTGCDKPSGATCTMSVTSDKTVTATFNVSHTLAVKKSGAGSGSVASSPAGINCGGACSAPFDDGTAVTLTASPAAGSAFTGWSGGGCSGTGTCVVKMGSDQSVSAAFGVTPTPPDTKIDKAKINQDKNSARFKFEALPASVAATSAFQCALVRKKHAKPKFKDCDSPKRYKHLKPGHYLFEVRASGPGGTDTTPAKKRFTIR